MENKIRNIIYVRSDCARPNGAIVGKSADVIENEIYDIYFRNLEDYEIYSELDHDDKLEFLRDAKDYAIFEKRKEEDELRATYDPYFNYKMGIMEASRKYREFLRAGIYESRECKIVGQHYHYLIKQKYRDRTVCRHCQKVLDYNTYMGNTNRGYRVCMQCKNSIPHFRNDMY